jgi:hypothetical protein
MSILVFAHWFIGQGMVSFYLTGVLSILVLKPDVVCNML